VADHPHAAVRLARRRRPLVELLLDLIDDGSRLVLEVAVPGILESDIDVTLAGARLILTAERPDRTGHYLLHEIERGILVRIVELPFAAELVRSTCEDGVLRLELRRVKE
jgi:HSP20 family molecular chaperone IbpA